MKAVGTHEYYLGGNVIQLGEDWKHKNISTALPAKIHNTNTVEKLAKMVGVAEFSSHTKPLW